MSANNQSGLNSTHLIHPFTLNSSTIIRNNVKQVDSLNTSSINQIRKTSSPAIISHRSSKLIESLVQNLIKSNVDTFSDSTRISNGLLELESQRIDSESPLFTNLIIIFLIFWNIYGFFIQIKLLFFTEIKELSDQIYDNCDKETCFFKYMIRLKYTELLNGYQMNSGTIMIDLLDTKDQYITRFTIPPDWLIKSYDKKRNKNSNTVKFKLNRKQEFPDIGSIKICHDLYMPDGCAIFIQNLQIKDLTNNRVTIVPINRPIRALGPDVRLLEQIYEANKWFNLESEGVEMRENGGTTNATIFEILMFIFIFINLSMMLTLIMKYSTIERTGLIIHILICTLSNISSLILLACLIRLYHHYVKERFILKMGTNNWRLIRLLFIAVSLNCSIIMDLVSFTMINYLRAYLDKMFIVSTLLICGLFTCILIFIHNSYYVKTNRRFKDGSLSLAQLNDSTREKQNLQVPLDLFMLVKNLKDQNTEMA